MTVQVITLVESHAIFREKKAGKSFGFKKRICLEQLLSEKPINFQSIITSQNCNKEFKKNIVTGLSNFGNEFIRFEQFYHFFSGYFFKSKRKLFKTGLDE